MEDPTRSPSLRRFLAGFCLLGVPVLSAFAPAPLAAQSVSCGGSRIEYVETGDDGLDPNTCPGGNTCVTPEVSGPTYTFASGCNPYLSTCAGTAVLDVHFPGNHHNPFNSFYSYATLELYSSGGSLVGTCGVPGATITQDFGTATVTGDTACFNPGAGVFDLDVISCKDLSGCEEITTVGLDFATEAGCEPPPMERCGTGDASCEDCLPGGLGVGGSPPGFGGPSAPETGPGATLRATAGGVGHANLPGSAEWNDTLGRSWSHDYAKRLVPSADESRVYLLTEFGTFRLWENPDAGGVYQDVAPSNEFRTLTRTASGFELEELDGTVHTFDAAGLWLSTTDRNGNATTATYSSGVLSAVDFPDGRREEFSYHPTGDPAEGKLKTITEVGVDGTSTQVWGYEWSGDDLVRVDRPDGTALLFTYGDPSFPGSLTRVELEGTDGTSTRVIRAWELDVEGNAVASWRGDDSKTGPDAVDVWQLAFDDPAEPTVTTATPPVGDAITYQLARDTVSDNVKVTSIAGDCPVCGLGLNVQLAYDDPDHPLLPTSRTNGRGFTTVMAYDAHGRMTSRTEAMGETEQRTTTWSYDATYPGLVTSREVPSVAGGGAFRTTEWIRDASGNATTRRITGMEAGSAFTHDTETSFNAAGRPLSVDPDGHGSADETSFTYDPARGDLIASSREDPILSTVGSATTFTHDPFNRRISVTDPNGVTTETDYDALDRVTAIRRAAGTPDELVTTHEYNAFRDLLRTKLPEGNVIEYDYDEAGRLISIERKPDASSPPVERGERTLYTLDAAGNRTREELQRWDADASAWVTVSETAFDYTNRCQVDRIVQAPETPEEAVTVQEYDCNGNLSARWDANHDPDTDPPTTSYSYDPLDRLTQVTQPWGGAGGGDVVTSYAYDVQDHLVEVTDAEGNVTEYTYSDRDLLTEEVSPVSGTTTHVYDEHGELTETTDARGITVTRTLDALDRVTDVDYPGTALDVDYSYDTAPGVCSSSFPVGRLGSITRDGQTVEHCYDRHGRTTRDGKLTYGYDGNGNRTTIGYPGGVQSTTIYDFADRPETLAVTSPGGTEQVVPAAGYLPSGPLSTLELGSGTMETRAFDGRYAPTAITLSAPVERTFTYTTDRVGNVLEILEQPLCTPGPLVLESQTVTTEELFVSCSTIEAGNGFAVESPGDVTFSADGTVALKDGFSVGSGASFTAGSGTLPELSRRTFGYQDVQYFLTSASGPWPEDLSWTYDGIGNRLTETRDAGTPATDTYTYATNTDGGNTPILDQVSLSVGGTRDYTWGAAGHLEEVAAGANVIDFAADSAGRMSGADRNAAGETAAFAYDGRSFLRRAEQTAGGTRSVDPVYDSSGRVHALRRKASSTADEDLVVFLYLAGRPVAQLGIAGDGTETWTYITTDHLGTPLVATDDQGAITWEGGFQPFGADWQAGTPDGALENGLHLRLPGQWRDNSWQDATSGADVNYNVARWYQPAQARYTRRELVLYPELKGLEYVYAAQNPLRNIDPTGEVTLGPGVDCENFGDIVNGLDRLRDDCACKKFFRQHLRTNLPRLLDQRLPELYTRPTAPMRAVVSHPGKFNCSEEPNRFSLERKLCKRPWFFKQRRINKAIQVTLHELAHYADCRNNNDSYQGEEGYAAEEACFGQTVGNPPRRQ